MKTRNFSCNSEISELWAGSLAFWIFNYGSVGCHPGAVAIHATGQGTGRDSREAAQGAVGPLYGAPAPRQPGPTVLAGPRRAHYSFRRNEYRSALILRRSYESRTETPWIPLPASFPFLVFTGREGIVVTGSICSQAGTQIPTSFCNRIITWEYGF